MAIDGLLCAWLFRLDVCCEFFYYCATYCKCDFLESDESVIRFVVAMRFLCNVPFGGPILLLMGVGSGETI